MTSNNNAIVLDQSFTIPVTKLDGKGLPQSKNLPYAIVTKLGSQGSIIECDLVEFVKSGKDPASYITLELDAKLNFIYTAYNVANAKNFISGDAVITNLTEVVLNHFLGIESYRKDSYDKSWVLLHSLIPLLEVEIDKLTDFKISVKRKLKTLDEKSLLTVWSNLPDLSDHIVSAYKKYAIDALKSVK